MTSPSVPTGLRYGPEHEWTSVDEQGIATVGITDHAQEQLGDVQYVELPEVGATVPRGSAFLEIESTKTVSEVYAPLSGVIVEVNTALIDDADRLNADPYGCWICRIRPSDPAELGQLMSAEEYRSRTEG